MIGIARRPVQEAGLFNRTREAQPGFRYKAKFARSSIPIRGVFFYNSDETFQNQPNLGLLDGKNYRVRCSKTTAPICWIVTIFVRKIWKVGWNSNSVQKINFGIHFRKNGSYWIRIRAIDGESLLSVRLRFSRVRWGPGSFMFRFAEMCTWLFYSIALPTTRQHVRAAVTGNLTRSRRLVSALSLFFRYTGTYLI